MHLADIASLSTALGATPSRNARISALAALLQGAAKGLLPTVATWLSGELSGPPTGVGPATVDRVLAALPSPAAQASLRVDTVADTLAALGGISGKGANARRQAALSELLTPATADERAFLAGLLTGSLRQGAAAPLVMAGLAEAFGAEEAAVRRAVMLEGALGPVALALATDGPPALHAFSLTLFRPVLPMLAETAPDPESLEPLLPGLLCEAKLDGARIQAHKDGGTVRLFSRALNDVTAALPDIVAAVAALPARQLIADGEAIVLLPDGRPAPFQTTMRRFGRKQDPGGLAADLPATAFLFDLLLVDGESLLERPLGERRERLERLCAATPAVRTTLATRPTDGAALQAFLDEVLSRGHEGIMVKDVSSSYEAGSRGAAWLKFKPVRTLDLVVIAAEQGSGRRSRWLSNLHLAARNDDLSGPPFVMLGKTFKGLTDALLSWQTEALLSRETHRTGNVVHVRPELVVEIAFQELEQSPHYPGGLALRFARVRRYRDDKTAAEADTMTTVRTMAGGGHRRDDRSA
jgi:DNA ligase-1